ncbi:hypothetical protein BDQ12DRAFT_721789 [Crucibulum laeve]|uniref:Uncharacterized protein n=1 Tax=Crucibulum laeve TaxID=68775 RepID=A0A5C3M4L3_9AGAR|nr:hypothetical protein BDQ12DRAFT_721789 [Crucibulum laeve]
MFATFAKFVTLSALVTGVLSGPLAIRQPTELAVRSIHSFNNWGGFSSLSNFDNFYGADNFDGSRFEQVVVQSQLVVEHQQELVCHTQQVEIIQQRLLVLQETAKRIITEQICDVETQTIVFEQWHSSLHSFSGDLRRHTGRQVGFDQSIVSHFHDIVSSDNTISTHDLGFSGHDLGRQTVVVHGNNWDDSRSFVSVEGAYRATRDAFHSLH